MRHAPLAGRRLGAHTLALERPRIIAAASLAGVEEGYGPLGRGFDVVLQDDLAGKESWELAESEMLRRAVELAARKAGCDLGEIDLLFAGDLLNQLVSTGFAARDLDIPCFAVYAACATLTAALTLAALCVEGGWAERCAVAVASHHDAAERQYRFPTELGSQRPPTAQWTATGAAAFIVAAEGEGPRLVAATPGRVVDLGVKDPFDMGAAMAPAAADTLAAHLEDTGRSPGDYDRILTGDLAAVGVPLAERLLAERGFRLELDDCGLRLYDRRLQDVHAGGSGAACSALVLAADVYPLLADGRERNVLLASTGALHSPTTYQQGQSIPAVCHAVWLAAPDGHGGPA